jgi:hypothetical protein
MSSSSIAIRLLGQGHAPRELYASLDETASAFKARVFADDLTAGRRVILVHFGQRIDERRTLRQLGVRDHDVLHYRSFFCLLNWD